MPVARSSQTTHSVPAGSFSAMLELPFATVVFASLTLMRPDPVTVLLSSGRNLWAGSATREERTRGHYVTNRLEQRTSGERKVIGGGRERKRAKM